MGGKKILKVLENLWARYAAAAEAISTSAAPHRAAAKLGGLKVRENLKLVVLKVLEETTAEQVRVALRSV
jgi:hypothetical protein